MLNEKDIDFVIKAYEQKNIVTREDLLSLDSRPYAKEMCNELNKRGYEEASMIESHLSGNFDYSSAIFNSSKFTYKEVDEYMLENILH